jgi:hypothetical protein
VTELAAPLVPAALAESLELAELLELGELAAGALAVTALACLGW